MITEYKIRVGIKQELYDFYKNIDNRIDDEILSVDKQFSTFGDCGYGMVIYMLRNDDNVKCVREYVHILREE